MNIEATWRRGYRFRRLSDSDGQSFPFDMSEYDAQLTFLDKNHGISGHASVATGKCIFIWGGCFDFHGSDTQFNDPTKVLMHCPSLVEPGKENTWIKLDCQSGDVPYPATGATMVYINGRLVIFGGFEARPNPATLQVGNCGPVNYLYVLNLSTRQWKRPRFALGSLEPSPRDKGVGWTYEDRPYFFSGYGSRPDSSEKYLYNPSSFIVDLNAQDCAWNNQLLTYDFVENLWSTVESFGKLPCPRAAASSASINEGRTVFLFGGRVQNHRLADLFSLDMTSMVWTEIHMQSPPIGRSWASLAASDDGKRVYVCGGYLDDQGGIPPRDPNSNQQNEVSRCILEADLENRTWSEFCQLEFKRYWHCGFLIDGSLVLIGGAAVLVMPNEIEGIEEQNEYHPSPIVECVRLQPATLQQLALRKLPTQIVKCTRHLPSYVFLSVLLRSFVHGKNLVDHLFFNYPIPSFITALGSR